MNLHTWASFDDLFDRPQPPNKKRRTKRKATKDPEPEPAPKPKERTQFTLTSLPVTNTVSEEDIPELMQAAPTPADETREPTPQVVAEQLYFNRHNSDFWQRDDLSHLRPFDFPYIRSMVQQAPQDTLSPEDTRHKETARATIEVVTREYEEKNLREPVGTERPCIMGENCQGMQMSHLKENKFVLKEFLLPTEMEECKRTRQWPKEARLCLCCKRAEIARAFINIRADGMGVKNNMILQDYRNITGVPGEYRLEDCILSSASIFQGLLDPVVLHIKSGYRVKTINGVRHLEQWRMKYPEHDQSFREGSSK